MRLSEQTIVVTGANGGLGREMAEAFLEEGANVVFADLPHTGLEATVDAVSDRPGSALAVESDVRSWEQVQSMVDAAVTEYGGVDVLVNNAGIRQLSFTDAEPVERIPRELWDDIVATNLTGAFLCTRATLPRMLDAGAGRVISITTGLWPDGRASAAAYVASKFGLEGLARSLALELEGTNVASLLLEPGGAVDTGLVAHLDEAARRSRMDPSVIAEPAVQLAEGRGANGGRYVATEMAGGASGDG